MMLKFKIRPSRVHASAALDWVADPLRVFVEVRGIVGGRRSGSPDVHAPTSFTPGLTISAGQRLRDCRGEMRP